MKQPPKEMTSVLNPITFVIWVIDIIVILHTITKQAKSCIVILEYMTKWVETRPLAAITEEAAKNFMLEQIILQFEIPNIFISDSGSNKSSTWSGIHKKTG